MFRILKGIKSIIINVLYKLIELIETYQYRNIKLDQNDISKKILSSIKLDNIKVMTDTGFESVSGMHITQPFNVFRVELENGYYLECADKHIVFDSNLNEIFIKDQD